MRVVFLVGAGISFDLLPLSKRLTELVRTGRAPDGREACRFSDSAYGLVGATEGDDLGRQHVTRVRAFFDWLASRLPKKNQDYEALFFACRQMYDSVTDEMENALIQPFLTEAERHALASPRPLGGISGSEELCREALNYIGGIISEALSPSRHQPVTAETLRHAYQTLLQACADPDVHRLDVVTLNHDTLLERSFREANLRVEDGFHKAEPGWISNGSPQRVQFWRGYRSKRRLRRLIKLHGSIDWWRVRPFGTDWTEETVARTAWPQGLRNPAGTEWETPDFTPLMLIGTFNKILDYTRPFHLQHYAVMRRALLMSDALVVAGYSFRDKAVNGMITDWYYTRTRGSQPVPPRPMVLIGPDFRSDAPPDTARRAIANKWIRWRDERRTAVISARFNDTDWHSIRESLVAHSRGATTR